VPEGDVVWLTASRLHDALADRTLTRSDFRVPRLATADLTGDVVTEAVPRGKHLLIRTKNGLTVHTHLRMDGSWRVTPAAEPVKNSHRIRLILANDAWQATGYQLGVVELVRTRDEHRIVGHLGPDLLGTDWDRDEAVRRLLAQPDRPIGEALMDQRNLAGIGNVYKAEVLFLRGISPWTSAGMVPDLGAVTELARELLDVNKDRVIRVTTGRTGSNARGTGSAGGFGLMPRRAGGLGGAGRAGGIDGTRSYGSLGARRGEETWVYGRRGLPCRRCGTPIRSEGQDDRITYWCPRCQPRDQTV
jgi:endonuclease-8